MSTAEQTLQRRALYTGLRPYLREREVMEALLLWESQYAKHHKFSLRYFVGELATQLNRKKDEKKMLLSLVSTANLADKDLLPDPKNIFLAYKNQSTVSTLKQTTPELEAAKLLIGKWLSMVDSGTGLAIEKRVLRGVGNLNINEQFIIEFKRWLTSRKLALSGNLVSITELRKITNLVYSSFCEVIGPVDTDRHLAEAITRLKSNGGAQFTTIYGKLL